MKKTQTRKPGIPGQRKRQSPSEAGVVVESTTPARFRKQLLDTNDLDEYGWNRFSLLGRYGGERI